MTTISIEVAGTPAPQGSKTRTRYGMKESSLKVQPWREAVVSEVLRSGHQYLMLNEPLDISIVFYLRRPMSHYRSGAKSNELKPTAPVFQMAAPDVDKLVRSTFDGLTQSGVVHDDSRFVRLATQKRFANTPFVGAVIHISTIGDGDEW